MMGFPIDLPELTGGHLDEDRDDRVLLGIRDVCQNLPVNGNRDRLE